VGCHDNDAHPFAQVKTDKALLGLQQAMRRKGHSIPLEVGTLNQSTAVRLWRSAVKPAGSGVELQPKSNLVYFCLKIWQMVATILMILFFFNLNIEN